MTRITLLLLLFTSTIVFGQDAETAKKWVLGGNFNFSSQTDEDAAGDESTLSNFELQPYLGYMLNEDWTLGVRLAYLNRSSEIGDSESTDNLIGFGVFSRYKFVQRSNWALFAEPELIIYSGSSERDGFLGDVESDLSGMQVGVGLGGYYQISPMWRFTVGIGGLGYATETEDFDGAEETSSAFGLDMGLNTIRVGMEMTF